MFSHLIFPTWFAGLVILVLGIVLRRREVFTSRGLDKLIALGPVFFAAPLAVFGAEHLVAAKSIQQIVPPWLPFHLFWAYFVGVALILAALSIALVKSVRLSAVLLFVLFLLFVSLIHIPNVIAKPHDRILWAVLLRDTSFAGGAWALAGLGLLGLSRVLIAIPVLFFAVEHFLHPEFAPGVPLPKLTPPWVPFPPFWGYLTGATFVVAGILILLGKHIRTAAAAIGLWVSLLTLFLYFPIFLADKPDALMEGVNYVADTLLFAGTALVLARAVISRPPTQHPRASQSLHR